MTSRDMQRSLLKGSSASRFKRAGDVSTQVRFPIRSESVVASPVSAPVSGSRLGIGVVSARAILQLFAPRSRTLGNVRLMSYAGATLAPISIAIGSVGRNSTRSLSHRRMATSSLR
jgi:hypothetical protein